MELRRPVITKVINSVAVWTAGITGWHWRGKAQWRVQGQRSPKLLRDQNLDNSVGRAHKEEKLGLGSVMQEETMQSLDKSWLQIKKEGRLKCGAKNINSSNRNQRRGRVEKISSTNLGMLHSRVQPSCRSKCSVKQPCCKTAPVLLGQGERATSKLKLLALHPVVSQGSRETQYSFIGVQRARKQPGEPKLSALKQCRL